jgi:uncharacterized protein YcfJ
MNKTAKILSIGGGIAGVVALTVGATLGIQALHKPAEATQPMAQVVAVNPNFIEIKKTTRSCHNVQTVTYSQRSTEAPVAGAVVGGVAGGLAGSLVKGKNQDLAIGAGAVLGAVTGATVQHNYDQQLQPQTQESQRCAPHTVVSQVQKGFQVAYTYNGQQNVVVMDNAPPVNSTVPLTTFAGLPTPQAASSMTVTSTTVSGTVPSTQQ